jgi:hypothetical protein
MSTPRNLSDKWFKDKDGKTAVLLPPNLPLIIALITSVLVFILPSGRLKNLDGLIEFGAFFTWSWLEIFKPVNYFRRLWGFVFLVFMLVNHIW